MSVEARVKKISCRLHDLRNSKSVALNSSMEVRRKAQKKMHAGANVDLMNHEQKSTRRPTSN
jgi:hypothetical protein